MKKVAASLLFALTLLVPAGAALATVEDRAGILTPDARAHLEQDLAQLSGHRFDVLYVDHVSGSLDALAKSTFHQHHLRAGDGVIVVAIGDKHVAVDVGRGFTTHGLSHAEISQHLKSDFFPEAKQGHYDVATENLAKGLLSETHTNTGSTTTYQGQTHPVAPVHHGGFPWGLLLFLGVAGGGVWWFLRRRGAAQLLPRIKALQEQHARIVGQALRLDEVDTLGRFREGAVALEYKKLGKRSADLMSESQAFGEALIEAAALAKKGNKKEAEPKISKLESRVVGLQSDVAAALTNLDSLEGTTGLSGNESDLPKLVQRLSRRYQELKDAYAELRKRAPASYNADATVESRLAESERLLTTVPVDAKEAERAILDATDALDAYRRSVEGEQDRDAARQGAYAWSDSPSYLPYVALPYGYHRPYFYTTYYEPPIVVYNDAGGGWGGGDSGAWGGDTASGGWGNDAGSLGDERRDAGWGSDSGSGGWGSDSGSSSWGGDSGGGGDFGGGGDW